MMRFPWHHLRPSNSHMFGSTLTSPITLPLSVLINTFRVSKLYTPRSKMKSLGEEEEEEEFEQNHRWRHGFFSCLGHLNPAFAWRRLQQWSEQRRARRGKPYLRRGSFKYDPMSYAQNFDEGYWDEEEETTNRGFSSRFAARPGPPTTTMRPSPESP